MFRWLRRAMYVFRSKLVIAVVVLALVVGFLLSSLRNVPTELVPLSNPRFSCVEVTGDMALHYNPDAQFSFALVGEAVALEDVNYVVKGKTLYVSRAPWTAYYEQKGFVEFFRLFSFSLYHKRTTGFPYLSLRFSNNSDRRVKIVVGKNALTTIKMKNGGKFSMGDYDAPSTKLNLFFDTVQSANIAANVSSLSISSVNTSTLTFRGSANAVSFFSRGGGEANFSGTANRATVNLGEDFIFRTGDFQLANLKIIVGNSSKSWVNVSSRIDADVRENSFLAYEGGAEMVIKKIAASGEVLKK